MSKKALIIGTSPRIHGNSNILAQAFAEGAKEAGKKIGFCCRMLGLHKNAPICLS